MVRELENICLCFKKCSDRYSILKRRQLGEIYASSLPFGQQFQPIPAQHLAHLLRPEDWTRGAALGIIVGKMFDLPPWLLLHLPWAFAFNDKTRQLLCTDVDECREAAESRRDQRSFWCPLHKPCCSNYAGGYECLSKTRAGLWWTCPSGLPNVIDLSL